MLLQQSSWQEVEAYLQHHQGILIPAGSTEQHGPMGLIGTDALCAELVATAASSEMQVLLGPTLAYTPAPFNSLFPGTISVSPTTFISLVNDILQALAEQGFQHIYLINGHGANLEPLRQCAQNCPVQVRIRSWWDFPEVNHLRQQYYGHWEGMHATPSEIPITQTQYRHLPIGDAKAPPEPLSAEYIAEHAGDKHGPPDQHRKQFPDGRVGSHSALAKPEHGHALLAAAVRGVVDDYREFVANN